MSKDGEADVIKLDFSKKPSLTRKKNDIFCICSSFIVDEHTRTVECDRCGKIWNSFDLILKWTRENSSVFYEIRHMQRQLKQLQEEFDELKRQERNVKSRLKRLKNK